MLDSNPLYAGLVDARLEDLLQVDVDWIKESLAVELSNWRHSSIWWKPRHGEAAAEVAKQQMRHWCKEFVKFRCALLRNEPVLESLKTWTREAATHGQLNVPQRRFYELLAGSCRRLVAATSSNTTA